jgi:hypothetical protein
VGKTRDPFIADSAAAMGGGHPVRGRVVDRGAAAELASVGSFTKFELSAYDLSIKSAA